MRLIADYDRFLDDCLIKHQKNQVEYKCDICGDKEVDERFDICTDCTEEWD